MDDIVVKDFPPNIQAIRRAIPGVRDNPNIVFAYDGKIYNPGGNPMPDHLLLHEMSHFTQQTAVGVAEWWARYLVDVQFRLEQEVQAYQIQYKFLCENADRATRRRTLQQIIKSLAGGMYGNIISREEAGALVKEGAKL